MDMQNRSTPSGIFDNYSVEGRSISKNYFANVFAFMFLALGISAIVAYLFATNPQLLAPLVSQSGRGFSLLGYIVLFAPLGFVLLMNVGFAKLSAPVLTLLFVLYSAITGVTLSFVLLTYSISSIAACFGAAQNLVVL